MYSYILVTHTHIHVRTYVHTHARTLPRLAFRVEISFWLTLSRSCDKQIATNVDVLRYIYIYIYDTEHARSSHASTPVHAPLRLAMHYVALYAVNISRPTGALNVWTDSTLTVCIVMCVCGGGGYALKLTYFSVTPPINI